MVRNQSSMSHEKIGSCGHTNREKKPKRRTGSRRKIITTLVTVGFISAACITASVSLVRAYQEKKDIERRTVEFYTDLYARSTDLKDSFEGALQNNVDYLVSVSNRNGVVVTEFMEGGVEDVTIRNVSVASGLPNLQFTGYTTSGYIEENSKNEIVDGVENLLTKYAAYTTYGGRRNDLNAELFYTLEVECAKWGVDPYMMLGIIMTESRGFADAKSSRSTATGLCQILDSTARSVYEGLLGHGRGTYNHNMAYDPELNIKMGVSYFGNLKRQYGTYRAIQMYRGKTDISGYAASINKFMQLSGKQLEY